MTDAEKIQDLEAKLVLSFTYVTVLEAKLTHALTRICELEALVSKLSTVKNSSNSSIPPALDLARKNQSLREKSNKTVGGQKGTNLEISKTPDKIEKIYPAFCNSCGESLADAHVELVTRRQVIDLPPIQYQSFATQCSCGHQQTGSFPSGLDYPIQYGENIQALEQLELKLKARFQYNLSLYTKTLRSFVLLSAQQLKTDNLFLRLLMLWSKSHRTTLDSYEYLAVFNI